jgi:hypothetical protein
MHNYIHHRHHYRTPLQPQSKNSLTKSIDSKVEDMEAADVDSTENQVARASQPMEKTVPDSPEDGTMMTTVGHVDLT